MKTRLNLSKTLLIFLLGALPFSVSADLVWEPGKGWTLESGILAQFFKNEMEAKDAVQFMNKAREAQEKGTKWSEKEAIRLYQNVWERYPVSILAPEALYQAGEIHVKHHQFGSAFERYESILQRYPNYPKFNQVVLKEYELATKVMEGKRPYYWGIIPGWRNYGDGMKYFEQIIVNAPSSEYAPLALMNISLLASKNGKIEDSIDALDRLISNYPNSILITDAYLSMGKTYASMVQGSSYDQGAARKAVSYLEDFTILFPTDPKLKEVERELARVKNILASSKLETGDFYYHKRNNSEAALIYYNQAITAAPDSESAQKARQQITKIQDGTPPPKTPVDFLFGRYKDPAVEYAKKKIEEQEKIDAEKKDNDAAKDNFTEAELKDNDHSYNEDAVETLEAEASESAKKVSVKPKRMRYKRSH